ncbi:hypothetical protein GWK08_15855 [Leptobacterium flavescens]|uniref:Peptidase M1 membrane alanine aminopeptidase domain-containing protein n=1 Tax=Leptobacterium flavescens TaxID=472055 RepID=A0A6P0UNH1_9FLAO|nr:M1 family aminopeptidase [Leptobacterium flavescens]NER14931.1 hypothetical protein [Leptobacterium flavescens]
MKKLILILISVWITAVSCSSEKTEKLTYEVSSVLKDSIPSLKIRASFKADPTGFTRLFFQDNAWGQEKLYDCLSDLKLVSEHGSIVQKRDSNLIEITHPKDLKEIVFEYTLTQDTKGPINTETTYRPVIQPEYFHLYSHNMFMLPRHLAEDKSELFDVQINWDLPEGHAVHNSFGSNERVQKISDIDEERFHSAVFTGGDFRIHPIEIENNKVYLASRGDWIAFKDKDMVDLLSKTIRAQRNFWNDHSQEYFTVTMIPFPQENGSSFQGTGLTNSFATSISNNDLIQVEGLAMLFNHELMHNWIGHSIYISKEEQHYWFSEGFTDYYTIKNISKNRILDKDEAFFIQEINNIIRLLYTSPVKDAPNSEINYDNFWSSRDYEKLPYRRGALFAFYLDLKIQRESDGEHSLDDLMRDFLKNAVEEDKRIDHSYFIEMANKYLKEDLKPFFEEHMVEGKLFDLGAIFDENGLEYKNGAKAFYKGYKIDPETHKVVSLDESSNAYKAGMRIGDRVVYRSVYSNPDIEAEFKVVRDKKEIELKFYPAKEVDIPQLLITDTNKKQLQ